MLPVTHLPDLILLPLFRQLPFADQLTASRVSPRFAVLISELNRSRRTLALSIGEPCNLTSLLSHYSVYTYRSTRLLLKDDGTPMFPHREYTKWNSLHLAELDADTVQLLGGMFPRIEELNLVVCEADEAFYHLADLLDAWRSQLVTLNFIEFHEKQSAFYNPRAFYYAINLLQNLKHLTLKLRRAPPIATRQTFPIVRQLEEFNYNVYHGTRGLLEQMLKHQECAKRTMTRIGYRNAGEGDNDTLQQFTSLSEHLRDCFIRLDFYHSDLTTVCAHFRNLTSVTFAPANVTFAHLFQQLSQLQQLIFLYLKIDFKSILPEVVQHHEERLLLPLNSLQVLKLELVEVLMHAHLAWMHLPLTTPNLQAIEFIFRMICSNCGYNGQDIKKNPERAKHCIGETLRPLKRDCAKLRIIFHNYESELGTAEEILAE